MCFSARQSFSGFNEVQALSELPFFVFDEIGQLSPLSIYILYEKTKLVRHCYELMMMFVKTKTKTVELMLS